MERLFLLKDFIIQLFLFYPILIGILLMAILGTLLIVFYSFYKEELTINEIRLDFDLKLLVLLIPIVIALNSAIFVYRIRNFGKELNLEKVFYNLREKIILLSYYQIIFLIVILILVILNMILFFLIIKKNTFIFFCKLNFYIINYLGVGPNRKESGYDKIKTKYSSYFFKILKIPINIFKLLFGERYPKIRIFIGNIFPYYGVIGLMSIFFFEIIFNSFILSKFYLVLPIFLIYQIGLYIDNFCNLTYDIEENIICNYLYDKSLLLINNDLYVAYNGFKFTIDDLKEIKLFINMNFDRNNFRKAYKEQYGEYPQLS